MQLPPLHLPQRWKSVLGRPQQRKIETKRRKKTWLLLAEEVQADSEVLGCERFLLNWVTAKQSKAITSPTATGTEHSIPPDHKCLLRQICRLSCPQKTPPLAAQNYPPRRRALPRPVWPSSLLRTLPGGELGKHPPRSSVTGRNCMMEIEQQLWELCRAMRWFLRSRLDYHNILELRADFLWFPACLAAQPKRCRWY